MTKLEQEKQERSEKICSCNDSFKRFFLFQAQTNCKMNEGVSKRKKERKHSQQSPQQRKGKQEGKDKFLCQAKIVRFE
jgi:hypothetical protein